jgi:hypothetical protein
MKLLHLFTFDGLLSISSFGFLNLFGGNRRNTQNSSQTTVSDSYNTTNYTEANQTSYVDNTQTNYTEANTTAYSDSSQAFQESFNTTSFVDSSNRSTNFTDSSNRSVNTSNAFSDSSNRSTNTNITDSFKTVFEGGGGNNAQVSMPGFSGGGGGSGGSGVTQGPSIGAMPRWIWLAVAGIATLFIFLRFRR